MFTVIGERINMTRKHLQDKVWSRDAAYIVEQVHRQAEAGATHIDINAGGDPAREVEDMKWLSQVVAQATDLPLVFDSSNPAALKAGLEIGNRPGAIINSITGEQHRINEVLPLVVEYDTSVVCLTMDDNGMPEDLDGRLRITREIVALLEQNGIAHDRAFVDPLVRPASTHPGQAVFILDAIRTTRREFPDIHIALGLSNISFGVPGRNHLNRAFLAMLVAAGCDGAIIDPCEPGMMAMLLASRAVLGLDEFCMDYLAAYREERL